MIRINNKDLVKITKNGHDFKEIYLNGLLIWPLDDVESNLLCFSLGYWVDEYPWDDNFYWRD